MAVRSFWHPLSTILLANPPCFASPHVVRMILDAERRVDLIYAGDRMGAALPHGSRFAASPLDLEALREGDLVLVCPDGVPDLLRLIRREAGRLWFAADADPEERLLAAHDLLARAALPMRRISRFRRLLARLVCDLGEARAAGARAEVDPAQSVRDKYDGQAVFYERSPAADLESGLERRIRERMPAGGPLLVVGSGTGKECFALARAGWRVTGLDFAPGMVAAARREAARRSVDVEFLAGDVRVYDPPPRSLSGVLFTYDVYSFVPQRCERVRLLGRIRDWLRPEGVVFLSARKLHTSYERAILTLQWLARGRRHAEWGDSHTRWISGDGTLKRAFVRYFTEAQLQDEIAAARFRFEGWQDAHGILSPTREDSA